MLEELLAGFIILLFFLEFKAFGPPERNVFSNEIGTLSKSLYEFD